MPPDTSLHIQTRPGPTANAGAGPHHVRPPPEDPEQPGAPPRRALRRQWRAVTRVWGRIGFLSFFLLVAGTIGLLFGIGFLTFLWLADESNTTWHDIALHPGMGTFAAIMGTVLSTSIGFQAIVCTSMVAAIAVEINGVPAGELASISAMRNTNAGPFWMTFLRGKGLYRRHALRDVLLFVVVLLISATALLSQGISPLLVTDLDLSSIQGSQSPLATQQNHFVYNSTTPDVDLPQTIRQITRGSQWLRQPPFYPSFAEYSDPQDRSPSEVLDTGPLLRAFLPFAEQQDRNGIADYNGIATVLDNRVICTRPAFRNLEIRLDGSDQSGWKGKYRFTLVGSTADNFTLPPNVTRNPDYSSTYPWACLFDPADSEKEFWPLSVCQIGDHSGLPSVFQRPGNYTPGKQSGAMYLVLNATKGTHDDWGSLANGGSNWADPPLFSEPGPNPVRTLDNDEWLDVYFSSDDTLLLSLSFCYAAFDTADLNIKAFSNKNRTEPMPQFDGEIGKYQYTGIRRQLGLNGTGSWSQEFLPDRGIFELEPRQSWLPQENLGDYHRPYRDDKGIWDPYISWVLDAAKIEGPAQTVYATSPMNAWLASNWTAHLTREQGGNVIIDTGQIYDALGNPITDFEVIPNIWPDPSYSSLMQEILQGGDGIAFALASMITVLAGATYYEKLGQFDGSGESQQTMFTLVLTPYRFSGYAAVMAGAGLHLVLVASIAVVFFTETKASKISNAWQTAAQVQTAETEELLELHTFSTDTEIKQWMKRKAEEANATNLPVVRVANATSQPSAGDSNATNTASTENMNTVDTLGAGSANAINTSAAVNTNAVETPGARAANAAGPLVTGDVNVTNPPGVAVANALVPSTSQDRPSTLPLHPKDIVWIRHPGDKTRATLSYERYVDTGPGWVRRAWTWMQSFIRLTSTNGKKTPAAPVPNGLPTVSGATRASPPS